MGLQEVMLARMKQSHGLSRPHAGSFARREQLPAWGRLRPWLCFMRASMTSWRPIV